MENKFANMDPLERIQMLKAMEFIARNVNSEEVMEIWFLAGVADGDIAYADTTPRWGDLDNLEYYLEDDHFADIMDTFLITMSEAYKDGGLYCNGVVSKAEVDE